MGSILHNSPEALMQAFPALEQVIDPEMGLNILDLGLVYSMHFEEAKITCTMTLTTQHCPMGNFIIGQVKEQLEQTFPVCEVLVELTFDPPWSEQRLSDRGRIILGQ